MIDLTVQPRTGGIAALVAALERVLQAESAWIDMLHDRPEHNRWRRGAPRLRSRGSAADRATRRALRRTVQ